MTYAYIRHYARLLPDGSGWFVIHYWPHRAATTTTARPAPAAAPPAAPHTPA